VLPVSPSSHVDERHYICRYQATLTNFPHSAAFLETDLFRYSYFSTA
jgi:hypothetical protein